MCKIRFVEDCELELIESYDEEEDHAETKNETFRVGEEFDVDFDGQREDQKTTNIQFGDGSMAYGVPDRLFVRLDE